MDPLAAIIGTWPFTKGFFKKGKEFVKVNSAINEFATKVINQLEKEFKIRKANGEDVTKSKKLIDLLFE